MLNTIENEKFYSPEDLAQHLQVSLSSIYKLIRSGDLPHIRLGKVYRIPASDLQRYLASKGRKISVNAEPKIPNAAKVFLEQLQESPIAMEILEIWLFGSYARGDYNPNSDIDLLVIAKERSLNATNLINEISEKAMASTDYEELLSIMEFDQEEWLTMKKDHYPLAQSIEGEGLLLWKNQ